MVEAEDRGYFDATVPLAPDAQYIPCNIPFITTPTVSIAIFTIPPRETPRIVYMATYMAITSKLMSHEHWLGRFFS
jgi:hypothetical protein